MKIIYGTIIALALVVLISSMAVADDNCLPTDTPELPPTETVVPTKEFTPTYPPTETEQPPPETITPTPDPTASPVITATSTPTVEKRERPTRTIWTAAVTELAKTGGNHSQDINYLYSLFGFMGIFILLFTAVRFARKNV